MPSIIQAIFPCLPIDTAEGRIHLPTSTEKHQLVHEKPSPAPIPAIKNTHITKRQQAAASTIVSLIFSAKNEADIKAGIDNEVRQAGGWDSWLAERTLDLLKTALKAGKEMGNSAYQKACEEAKLIKGFSEEHPIATEVFLIVIALGILVIVAPTVIEWLGFWVGFGEEGPIEGMCLANYPN